MANGRIDNGRMAWFSLKAALDLIKGDQESRGGMAAGATGPVGGP
jgi:hypothetical protein